MKTYTRKEIAFILQCSERVISDDIKHLRIQPIERADYGQKLYSDLAFELISSLRKHCRETGKTRGTFIPTTPTEIVEKPLQKIISKPPTIIDSTKQFIEAQLKIDPFYDLELLQRIVDNKWLLPTKRLAAIINIHPSTLVREDSYKYCGYLITKTSHVGDKNGSWLWSVTRYH